MSELKKIKVEKGNGYIKVGEFIAHENELLERLEKVDKDGTNELKQTISNTLESWQKKHEEQQKRKKWDKFFYTFLTIGVCFFIMAILITLKIVEIEHSEELLITFFSYFIAEKVGIATYLGVEITKK